MEKQFKSILSLILSLLLVFTMVAPTVFAEGEDVSATKENIEIPQSEPEQTSENIAEDNENTLSNNESSVTTEETSKPEQLETQSKGPVEKQPKVKTSVQAGEQPKATSGVQGEEQPKTQPKIMAAESVPTELNYNIITNITLNDESGVDLSGKGSVKKDSKVQLVFDYVLSDETEKKAWAGDTFTFSLPDELRTLNGQFDLEGTDDNGKKISYGTGIVKDGHVQITFSKEVEKDGVSGEFFFNAEFVEEKIGDNSPVPITFKVKGDSFDPIYIDFEQKVIIKPSITKQGKLDKKTNIITWDVEISSNDEAIKDGLFEDSIQSDQEYVEGSFKLNPGSVDSEKLIITPENKINYTFTEIKQGASVKVSFQTKIKGDSLPLEDQEKTYKNQATIQPKDYESPIKSNEAMVTVNTNIIEKSGTPNKLPSGATTIDWTITINPDGWNIKNNNKSIVLKDVFDKKKLQLVQDSVKVFDGQNEVTGDLGTLNLNEDGFNYTINNDITKTYVVKYTTLVVDENFLVSGKTETFNNTATLTGLEIINGSASAEKGVGVGPNRISKNGNYDRSTHEITWKIEVNNDNVPLKDVVLTDNIPEGQTFVKGSSKVTSAGEIIEVSPVYTPARETEKTPGTLTWNLNNINKRYTIEFKTTVDNSEDYATNHNGVIYYNNASIVHDNGITDEIKDAKVNVKSNVIKKAAGNYNYAERTITWTLTINENKMPLTDIKVQDVISDDFEYVPGSAKTTIENLGLFDINGKTLTFTSNANQEIEDQFDIIFTTKVTNPDIIFKKDEDLTVKNKAKIQANEIPGIVTSNEASTTIKNKIVSKSGTFKKEEKSITWKIDVNPNHITIPTGATIKDTLQEGLELDLDSVKLFSATFDPSKNALVKGSEVTLENGNIQYDGSTRQFDFTFPEAATNVQSAYILEFSTDVMKAGTYTNSVVFDGTGSGLTGNSANIEVSKANMGGTGTGSTKTIKVIKVDKATNEKLSGAVFELWMYHPRLGIETFVRTATSDNDGQVLFDRLRSGIEYTVKEIKAPQHYQLSKEEFKFTLDSVNENLIEKVPYQFKNERINGTVEFIKTGENDQPLAGAEFTLYDSKDVKFEKPIDTAVSQADGKVTFLNVPIETNLVIIETKAPSGYNLTDKKLDVRVAEAAANDITIATPDPVKNEKTKGSIEFEKIDELGKPLAGAEFQLYTEANSKVGNPVVSDANGLVVFNAVEHGNYIIKELKAPQGYQLSSNAIKVKVDKEEGHKYLLEDFKNYRIVYPPLPNRGHVKALKTDGNGKPLVGAEFGLFAANGSELARTVSTLDGVILFENILIGDYTIKEIKAPKGYKLSDEKLDVHVTYNSIQGITKAEPYEISNQKIKGNIQFTKTDEKHKPLAGAEFELYTEDLQKIGNSVVSNEAGLVEFKNIEHGKYIIKEVKAPVDYEKSSEAIKVTIDGNEGQIYKLNNFINEKSKKTGEIKVLKVDERNLPLAGAEFTLYASDGTIITSVVSDSKGIALFEVIPYGRYVIKESKAPSGYIRSDEIVDVNIIDSIVYDFTFINKKADSPVEPDPGQNPNPSPDPDPTPGPDTDLSPDSDQNNSSGSGNNSNPDVDSNTTSNTTSNNNNAGGKGSGNTKVDQGLLPKTGGEYYNYLLLSGILGILGVALIIVDRYRRKTRTE